MYSSIHFAQHEIQLGRLSLSRFVGIFMRLPKINSFAGLYIYIQQLRTSQIGALLQ